MKRIRLTEGQLHRLIEQTLNEWLPWQTKASAAIKAIQKGNDYFKKAEDPNLSKQEKDLYDKLRDRKWRQGDNLKKNVDIELGDRLDFFPEDDMDCEDTYAYFGGIKDDGSERGVLDTPYTQRTIYGKRGKYLTMPHKNPYDEDVIDYFNGDAVYNKDLHQWVKRDHKYDRKQRKRIDIETPYPEIELSQRAQKKLGRIKDNPNESLARRVTESVLRKLREATQMDNDDSMFQDLVGKFYHEMYRDDRSTPKTTFYSCLPITDVRELESGIIALILDNKRQANFWPQQLKGILNGTYTPMRNMKLFIADKNHWDVGEKEEYDYD